MALEQWVRALLQRRYPITVLTVALLISGGWAASTTPIEWAPSLRLASLSVTAQWPGASPRNVEKLVTAPLERALQGISGTQSVTSSSSQGASQIRLRIAGHRSLAHYKTEVSGHLALLQKGWPEGVTASISQTVPAALQDERDFMTLRVLGSESPRDLRRVAETSIVPRFQSVPGIASVEVFGGQQEEVRVAVDPAKAETYGLAFAQIEEAVRDSVKPRVLGRLRESPDRSALLVGWCEETAESLRRIVLSGGASGLAPGQDLTQSTVGERVLLEDVADVQTTGAPVRSLSRIDGRPAITLILERAPNSPLLDLARAVHHQVQRLDRELPGDVRVEVSSDRSEAVRQQLSDLSWRGGGGLLLILLVLVFRLRSVRATTIVAISVLASLAVALILLRSLGLTLNILTFAGLTLTVGLLIDNALIVVEHLLHRLRREDIVDDERLALAGSAALRRVALPLVGGTLTTLVALGPLVYLSGELRAFFVSFATVVGFTLLASLVSAFLLVPALAGSLGLGSGWQGRPLEMKPSLSLRASDRRFEGRTLEGAYRLAGRFPVFALLLLLLGLGLPTPLVPDHLHAPETGWDSVAEEQVARRYNATLGSEPVRRLRQTLDLFLGGVVRPFLEQVELGDRWSFPEEPEIFVRASLPSGSGLERTDATIRGFEQDALEWPAVRRTLARVDGEQAMLRIVIHREFSQHDAPLQLRQALIGRALELAGVEIGVSGLIPEGYYSGVGTAVGLTVEATGPSYDGLETLARELESHLRREPRVGEVDISVNRWGQNTQREILGLDWDSEVAAQSGASARDLHDRLRPRLLTHQPTLHTDLEGQARLPVRVVLGNGRPPTLQELMKSQIEVGAGSSMRLEDRILPVLERQPQQIERANQKYRRYIQILYQGHPRKGRDVVDSALEAVQLPLGYSMERVSFTFFSEAVTRELLLAILAALVVTYLALTAIFESWSLPAVVLLSVPLAFLGVAAGFLVSGAEFAEGAFIGLVLLIGIAVNDSILLVYRFGQLRNRRRHGRAGPLARLAVRQRLQPMWTTTLTSIAGMLPLIFFPGEGDFWLGLAITLVGGLLASTLLAPAATVAILSLRSESPRGT